MEGTSEKLKIKFLPGGFFHSSCADYPWWNTLFSHSSVTHPQECQSRSAAFETESTKRGAWWGVTVYFIPTEEGRKAKQGLSIFPVSVLPKHASGPGSMAPTSTWAWGLDATLRFWKSAETGQFQKAGYSIWNEINNKAASPLFTLKNLGLELLRIFVLPPYDEDALNSWDVQRPK